MNSLRAVTRRAALAAFLLFATALFVVGPADASRTTDARSSPVSSSSRELASLELPMLEPLEPADSVFIPPRFGFAEDLSLLDVEARPCGFELFGGVGTRRCALTYARNNPLNFVDPNGLMPLPVKILWEGAKAGWGWAEHVVLRHVRQDLYKGRSKYISEAVARKATEETILHGVATRQADGLILKQLEHAAAVGTKGQTVSRVVVSEIEPGVEAVVTSFPAKAFKLFASAFVAVDLISSPWDASESRRS